jgi:lipopolysaccharide transport system permease protein
MKLEVWSSRSSPTCTWTFQQYRELLITWIVREIRVRYKQSILGAAWAILQPLALMLAFTLVFSYILEVPTGEVPYPLFSYTALAPWTFFASSISMGTPSLVNNMNLITKVRLPRELLPIATVLAGFLDFAVASVLLVGMMLIYQVEVTWALLWVLPLLLVQLVLTFAVVLTTSSLNVLYRDIRFLVPLGTQLWMYASPIIYGLDLIPPGLRPIYYLNPMAALIDGYRRVLLIGSQPDLVAFSIAAAVSACLLVAACILFKKLEPDFADII